MPCPSIRSRRDRAASFVSASVALLVAILTIAIGTSARAADGAAVKQAQAEHRRGEAAFKVGRYEEAIAAWERGYALAPRPLFIVNLAHAERRRGQLRKALALYKRYLVVDPETSLRGEVSQVVAELEDAIAAEEAAQAPRSAAPPAASLRSAAPLPAYAGAPAPPPAASRPFYTRWWFWTAAGAVVAGAAAAALLVGAGAPDYQERGTLGDFKRGRP